jgi:hypothetical protein
MDSNKELKNENNTATSTVADDDSVKRDIPTDMKKFITKVDNRVKTKVRG